MNIDKLPKLADVLTEHFEASPGIKFTPEELSRNKKELIHASIYALSESMKGNTVKELRKIARTHKINLGGARRKKDITEAITESLRTQLLDS